MRNVKVYLGFQGAGFLLLLVLLLICGFPHKMFWVGVATYLITAFILFMGRYFSGEFKN